MTFREKLQIEYPDHVDSRCDGGCKYCPSYYGYESGKANASNCALEEYTCTMCWNREIPEEKTNEKGETKMAKTKAELLEDIEKKNEEIKDLKKEVEKFEKYKAAQETADELGAYREAFRNAGFSESESFELVKDLVGAALQMQLRR